MPWRDRARWSAALGLCVAACSAFGGKLEATDAGADAGDGGRLDDGGATFCARVDRADLLFCDDFEHDIGLANWHRADSDEATRYGIGDQGFASKASARLELVPHPAPDADARIERGFSDRVYSWFRLDAVVRLVRREADDADLVTINFGQTGTLKLRARGNVRTIARFPDGGAKSPDAHGSVVPLPLDEWVPIAIEFDFQRSSSRATVLVRGVDVIRDLALDRDDGASPFNVRIGPAETPSSTTGWLLEVDNVVVRGRP